MKRGRNVDSHRHERLQLLRDRKEGSLRGHCVPLGKDSLKVSGEQRPSQAHERRRVALCLDGEKHDMVRTETDNRGDGRETSGHPAGLTYASDFLWALTSESVGCAIIASGISPRKMSASAKSKSGDAKTWSIIFGSVMSSLSVASRGARGVVSCTYTRRSKGEARRADVGLTAVASKWSSPAAAWVLLRPLSRADACPC